MGRGRMPSASASRSGRRDIGVPRGLTKRERFSPPDFRFVRLNAYPIRVRTCPQRVHGMHNDPVDSPEHYQFGQLQAWEIIELAIEDIQDSVTAYHVASALKYLLRAARKGGDTDIAKASAHLKRETARHVVRIPTQPEYDPDSVAFRHGDVPLTTAKEPAYAALDDLRRERPGRTAAELADADGCVEYGNPVTPGCATWVDAAIAGVMT